MKKKHIIIPFDQVAIGQQFELAHLHKELGSHPWVKHSNTHFGAPNHKDASFSIWETGMGIKKLEKCIVCVEEEMPTQPTEINHKKQVVVYQAPNAGIVKLQRLDTDQWAFVYLQRPDLTPVFVRDTPEQCIEAAERKNRICYIGDHEALGQSLIENKIQK